MMCKCKIIDGRSKLPGVGMASVWGQGYANALFISHTIFLQTEHCLMNQIGSMTSPDQR